MSQIKKLFKLQLDNKFNLFKSKDAKTICLTLLKYFSIIAAITLGLYLILNKVFLLLAIEINSQLIGIVICFMQVITFFFALANIIQTMYLSKDNELLMTLPVTFDQLFVSKSLILYVSDLIFNATYMLPVFLTLGFLGGLNWFYFVMILLIIPIMPILPIAVASLISIPTIFVIKYFKKHTVLSIVTILLLVAVIFVAYMSIVGRISSAFNIAEKQIETGLKINNFVTYFGVKLFGFYQLGLSMLNAGWIWFPLAFLVCAMILMLVCLAVIKPFYYKIATINMEQTFVVKDRYYRPFKKRKPFAELLLNEIRLTFRSAGYIFQFFLFPLFMPLIVYTYDKLVIDIAVNQTGRNMIFGTHILILTIIALMSNIISSIAISKEGGVFYIAKTSPVPFRTQALAKIVFNAIFTIGSILITTIITLLFPSLPAWVVLLSSLTVILLSIGHICHSFDMDLRSPVLDWYDNSEISTIGKNTTKSMIWALVFSFAMCLCISLMGTLGVYIALAISVIYAVSRIHMLDVRLDYYYDQMEI